MPQLIALVLIAAVVWYGYSAFKKELAKLAEQDSKDAKKHPGTSRSKVVDELEQDPETGVYRPKNQD